MGTMNFSGSVGVPPPSPRLNGLPHRIHQRDFGVGNDPHNESRLGTVWAGIQRIPLKLTRDILSSNLLLNPDNEIALQRHFRENDHG